MEPRPTLLKILDWLTVIFFAVATYLVLVFAPTEATMGNVQRVFYFHVSAGWVGMIGYLLAVVAGIAYLRTANRKWDVIGLAGIEIGLVFMLINIVTGRIPASGFRQHYACPFPADTSPAPWLPRPAGLTGGRCDRRPG